MYYTKEQPTTGSFTKVWVYGEHTFSSDYMYIDNRLCVFNDQKDDYEVATLYQTTLDSEIEDVIYITKETPNYTEMK